MSETSESSGGLGRIIMILLLLIALVLGALWYLKLPPFARDTGDGSFVLNFKGCDDDGKCADFTLYAPGYAYSWTLSKDEMAQVDGAQPDLTPKVETYLAEAEGVISAGLASQEGDALFNLPLSACRSHALNAKLQESQTTLGTNADMYRVTLGGYAVGQEAELPEGTEIQRQVVMAFFRNSETDVNISQALKNGLTTDLPAALVALLAPQAAQLDFTKYDCWNEKFEVTPSGVARTTCFPEPSSNPNLYCQTF